MGRDDHEQARSLAQHWIEEATVYEWHEIPSELKGLLIMAADLYLTWDTQQDQLITSNTRTINTANIQIITNRSQHNDTR